MAPINDENAIEIKAETDTKVKDDKKKDDKKGKKDKDEEQPDAMSEEDQELKERLETCVSTVLNTNNETNVTMLIRTNALDIIVNELRSATSSMTSVPKPLKFLRPFFDSLKDLHSSFKSGSDDDDNSMIDDDVLFFRARLADVLAVLAMTMGKQDERESLNFKLLGMKDYKSLEKHGHEGGKKMTKIDNVGIWGHEFARSIAGEIGQEYNFRVTEENADPDSDEPFEDLLSLVDVIVPFHVTHNAEAEAIDLLIEVQRLKKLLDFASTHETKVVDENNYGRICLYLIKTADYMSDPDDLLEVLETALELFRAQGQYYDALRVVLRMGNAENNDMITELFSQCKDDIVMKKQMCLLLGRHKVNYEVTSEIDEDNEEELNEIIGNVHLSEQFLKLGQDLDVVDAKTPEDIYKSHLAETGGFSRRRDTGGAQVDSARANLASTFVNAFVNAGFGQDKLMTPDNEWLYKNKDHGMLSAAASLGLILLWNVEEGLTQIDKFLYSSEDYVKAGAALAVGILSSGVRNDADPALALLAEHVEGDVHIMKCAACT